MLCITDIFKYKSIEQTLKKLQYLITDYYIVKEDNNNRLI